MSGNCNRSSRVTPSSLTPLAPPQQSTFEQCAPMCSKSRPCSARQRHVDFTPAARLTIRAGILSFNFVCAANTERSRPRTLSRRHRSDAMNIMYTIRTHTYTFFHYTNISLLGAWGKHTQSATRCGGSLWPKHPIAVAVVVVVVVGVVGALVECSGKYICYEYYPNTHIHSHKTTEAQKPNYIRSMRRSCVLALGWMHKSVSVRYVSV